MDLLDIFIYTLGLIGITISIVIYYFDKSDKTSGHIERHVEHLSGEIKQLKDRVRKLEDK